MVVEQFARILRARFGIVLLIVAAAIAASVAVSLIITPKYQASTTLVVEVRNTDPVLGGAAAMAQTVQGHLVTQSEIIRSERVMNRVIDALSLDSNPTLLTVATSDAGQALGSARSRIVRHFERRLTVDASREGTTLVVSYEGPDPELTAAIVNAFARAYIDVSTELKTGPATSFRTWFETQTRTYRERLEAAQRRLSAAQRASGILVSDERLDVENVRLTDLSNQLVAVQAALADSRSRADTAQRGAGSMPEVVSNPLLQTLSGDLGRAEARLQQLSARLGPAHPEYQSVQAEVDQLRTRLQSETARVGGSIVAGNQINLRRETELLGLLDAQRGRVAGLKTARDQLQTLEREVQGAQRGLDLVTQRFTETSLESQARTSGVAVLTPASVPLEPSRPQLAINTLAGTVFGLVLAVLAALTLESMNRPVRTAEDLQVASDVPVLAVLPRADTRRPQRLIGNAAPGLPGPGLKLGQ
jgi:succinoglycan biosynthesis transport protein ExoP